MKPAPSQPSRLGLSDREWTRYPLTDDQILEGTPIAETTVLWQSEDRRRMVGMFRMTPGRVRLTVDTDELMVVQQGCVILETEDGAIIELHPGDSGQFPAGTEVTMTIIGDFRDTFFVDEDRPM